MLKDGKVYTCWPKQKEIKNGVLVTSFEKTRNISEDNRLNHSNIKKYTDFYIIKKNGNAKLLIQQHTDGPGEYFCLKKVKSCMVTKELCFWLKKNGMLYCGKKKGLKVVKKKLIAKKVKFFSKSNGGVYYLTKDRKLHFARITKK